MEDPSRFYLRLFVFCATCVAAANYFHPSSFAQGQSVIGWAVAVGLVAAVVAEFVVSHIVVNLEYKQYYPDPFTVSLPHKEAADAVRKALKKYVTDMGPDCTHEDGRSLVSLWATAATSDFLGRDKIGEHAIVTVFGSDGIYFDIDFETCDDGKTTVTINSRPAALSRSVRNAKEDMRKKAFSPQVNLFMRPLRASVMADIRKALKRRKKQKDKDDREADAQRRPDIPEPWESIDEAQAAFIKEQAAEGDDRALLRLGWMYEAGELIEQDYELARECYDSAAYAGNTTAQWYLAIMLRQGAPGVPPDPALAFGWCRTAANKGMAAAMADLGYHHYYKGVGTKKDLFEAEQCLIKAADAGHSNGQWHLGAMILAGETEKYREIYPNALYFLSEAARQGNSGAQYDLGLLYENGYKGAMIDKDQAKQWFAQAAEKGHAEAQAKLETLSEETV